MNSSRFRSHGNSMKEACNEVDGESLEGG